MRSKAYYRVRAVVRFVFWSAVIIGAMALLVKLLVAYWDAKGL